MLVKFIEGLNENQILTVLEEIFLRYEVKLKISKDLRKSKITVLSVKKR